jgi:hypothetical protein
MLFVYADVPKHDAHIVTLRLAEAEDQRVGKVSPHIVRLDVGEQDVCVHSESNAQAKAFPSN